jgi:hypothetical protein
MDYDKLYADAPKPPTPKIKDLPPLPDTASTREKCAAMEDEIIGTWRHIMHDETAPPAARNAAAAELANRGFGKQAASADAGMDNKLEVVIMRMCPKCQACTDE